MNPETPVRVKICGIRSLEEATLAVDAGADAVGLLVAEGLRADRLSEDRIPAAAAAPIVVALPPFVASVLVTHLADPEAILGIWKIVGTAVIQLHSNLPPEAIRALRQGLPPRVKLIGRVAVDGRADWQARVRELEPCVDALLTDTRTADREGGTGLPHAAEVDAAIVRLASRPVILAGGLTPANVAERVCRCRPWGVDVNTGVGVPGSPRPAPKDQARVRQFVEQAKRARSLPVRAR